MGLTLYPAIDLKDGERLQLIAELLWCELLRKGPSPSGTLLVSSAGIFWGSQAILHEKSFTRSIQIFKR